MRTLLDLRDEALAGSKDAHARVSQELAIYRNKGYTGKERVGGVVSMAKESIDPKIRKGVNRLIPGFVENAGRIEVQPDKSYRTDDDIQYCEDIQGWLDMNDDATDEGEELTVSIQHNLALGNHVCKIGWDHRRATVVAEAIHPLSFYPDPSCRKSNMSDADFVLHREPQTGAYIARNYPKFKLESASEQSKEKIEREVFRNDELWLRPWQAAESGVKVDPDAAGVIVAVIINDVVHRVRHSPYWWPDFPFAHWRNFLDVEDNSAMANNFWGHGYGEQLWNSQKLLDEMLANLILIARNQAVGRIVSKQGMFDMEQILPVHGLNIEFPEGYKIEDFEHLPPDAVPAFLGEMLAAISQSIDEEVPSLNDVFTGQEPQGDPSGRAINALQYASFSQLSANIRRMNDFRLRRARIKVTMLQQFARKPLAPHLWRGGIDLPSTFAEDARYVGYHLALPDTSQLPNTPAGRLQVVQMLANMGMVMTPERMLEFIGLDKGFGLQADDFMPAVQQVADQAGGGTPGQMDEGVVSGLEAAMKAER